MIPFETIKEMFINMRAQTSWKIDGDMLWGYFFMDPDKNKLQQASQSLGKAGYRLVQFFRTDDGSTYVLHVERIETHTPESLHARNLEFDALAQAFGLARYDGMDVGPVI